MRLRYSICVVAMVVACAMISLAQETKPAVKHGAAATTSPSSGKEMFTSYCAPCHGKSGKGDGPAAAALKQPPARPHHASQRPWRKVSLRSCNQCA
jgi:mono/diheme cytochrome c family protein